MIRPSSIAIGELIAVGGYTVQPSSIIDGLNELSVGAFQYTPENFRDGIVAVTADNAHSEILEAASTSLAAIIRSTMDTVRQYGVPLADAVVAETSLMYSRSQLRDVATDAITIKFVNADDPFFDSPLFPTAVADTTMSYQNISLEALSTLTFDWVGTDDINAFINSNHPDVREILDSPESALTDAADLLKDMYWLKETFHHQGDLFNFKHVKSTDVNLLLKAYILLTKMRTSDDPVTWLKGGDLGTYRSYVHLLWNGFTTYLLQLKDVIKVYRAQQLTFLQDKEVALSNDYREFKKAQYLRGKVRVFYTTSVMNKITEGNLSFNEIVLGYFWALLNGRVIGTQAVAADPQLAMSEAQNYFQSLHAQLTTEGRELFIKGGLKAITEFIAARKELSDRIESSGALRGRIFSSWVSDTFYDDLNAAFNLTAEHCGPGGGDQAVIDGVEVGISERTQVMLSTTLVPNFLRAVGCNLAADLIADTFIETTTEDNTASQRERLSVAIINLIVDKSLVG